MIKYNSVVNPKNTDRIIYTGTIEELKLLLSKFSLRDGVKVTFRRLRSYRKPIYRVWIS